MEGYSKDMSGCLIFCQSPHVAGTIGEISRDIALAVHNGGKRVHFVSTCEPVSYAEQVEGMGYPVLIEGVSFYCSCGAENIIVSLYDHIGSINPDILVSIGERAEVELASAAIQVSGHSIRHIHVWTGSSEPSVSACESMSRANKVVCFGKTAHANISKHSPNAEWIEVKSGNACDFSHERQENSVLMGGPCNDVSNLLCAVEGLRGCDLSISAITNLYEQGDYDIRSFSESMDMSIDFGSDPYGTFYGLDNRSVCAKASKSSIFLDTSIKQSSCFALDCAIRSGCIPILSKTPRHIDFLSARGLISDDIDLITIDCSKFRPSGGDCIWISDPDKLNKIIHYQKDNRANKDIIKVLIEYSYKFPTLQEEILKFLQ